MERFWDFFTRKKGFSYLLLIAIILFGLYSLSQIPRESSPEVEVPIAVVTTIFPNASASDVERLVTNKLEDGLNNLENLKDLSSSSREGVSSVVVEFDASADIDSSVQDVKDEVDKVKPELPTEAEDPIVVNIDFVNQPIQTISISSDLPMPEFISLVEEARDELKKVQGVSDISIDGIPEREVQVIVQKAKLSKFGLSISDVTSAISSANSSLPVGNIEVDGISYAVSFEGSITDPNEVENIVVATVNNHPVYVRDIALVSNGVSESNTLSRVSVNGSLSAQSATLSVFKRTGGDITRIAKDIRDKIAELEKGLLSEETVLISFDTGEFVEDDLKNLSLTALQTIILVMIVLLISLGWREAIIAGLAIPLSFLLAFVGLYYSGNTINFVSLFSLILAVGILVDSAIVITEAIHTRLKQGNSKEQAAIKAIHDFHWPLTSGTMTTIAVFAPLFLISGITGEFISSIPFTIIFVLIASIIVALGIVPLIASSFLRSKETSEMERRQEKYTDLLQGWYKNKLRLIVGKDKKRIQKWFFAITTVVFIASFTLPAFGLIKIEFFPQEDIDFIYIEVERSEGTVLGQTDLSVRAVEEMLYDNKEIDSFVTTVGSGSIFGSAASGSKLGNITINLDKERDRSSSEIVEELQREVAEITDAKVRVSQPNNGPPGGSPVLITFSGEDLEELNVAANIAESVLADIQGATSITTSNQSDATEFSLMLNRERLAEVGLNPALLAGILRTSVSGVTATSINNLEGDVDIVVKLDVNSEFSTPDQTNIATIDDIRQIELQTPKGPVLVGSVVDVGVEKSNSVINHEDRKRISNVSADLVPGAILGEVISEFESKMQDIELPDGVEIKIGGETEETTEAFKEMLLSLLVGLVLIIAILVLQFNSYRQVTFIVIIIPLSLIGVFVGLAISGKALSFPSIMGFIALSGIVVNNSIILIDTMNQLRKENPNRDIDDVVIEGATTRLRPILLTTITTVVGIFPLTYASELWGPLAYAVMFGLSFAVIVTLVLVPVLYSRWPGKTIK